MKPFLPSFLALLLVLALPSAPAQAQVRVQVNVGAPVWGPPVPAGVQYYYIPEIDGYYDLYSQSYLYFDPYYGDWVSSPMLPAYYANYDPRFFHPVVVQYVGRQPWGYIYDHRSYCNTRGWRPGYYRSAPGPNCNRGYYSNGPQYRPQPGRYDNRPYAQQGYPGGYRRQGGGYYERDEHRDDHDDRRGGYDNRRDQPNGPGHPDYGPGQPGRGPGGFGGNGNGPGGFGNPGGGHSRNGRVR